MLWVMNWVLFVLELLQELVVLRYFLILVALELDLEGLGFPVYSPIEVLVIVGKFASAFVVLQPQPDLILDLPFLLILRVFLFSGSAGLQDHLFVLQAQADALIAGGDVEAEDG